MFTLSYTSTWLYKSFCNTTGFIGTTKRITQLSSLIKNDKLKITFCCFTDPKLPWLFYSTTNEINIQLGETIKINYTIKNLSNKSVIAEAIYNVSPHTVGKYFNKVQCFCFNKIFINAYEKISLPLIFNINPLVKHDINTKSIKTITLNYTLNKIN